MKIKVKVTEKDIAMGDRKNSETCPIACRLSEMFPGKSANIYQDYIKLSFNDRYLMPRSAERFIKAFDKSKPVKPFNFILDTEKLYKGM